MMKLVIKYLERNIKFCMISKRPRFLKIDHCAKSYQKMSWEQLYSYFLVSHDFFLLNKVYIRWNAQIQIFQKIKPKGQNFQNGQFMEIQIFYFFLT